VTGEVRYADPEPNGLATMLGGLIEANLAAHPDRGRLLARSPATFSISAPDVGVAASIRLASGGVVIRNGVVGKPQIRIEARSDNLLGLSAVPLKFGLPDVTTKEGREVNRKLFKGELKVRGLLLHPAKLGRLNKLLSAQ
jgi:hypothetical protein